MAKRKAFLHIGPAQSGGGFLDSALAEHADALAEAGLKHPAISAEEMFRAAIEIRRDHKAWGYQRREVEGAWAGICRRAWKGKGTVVLSQELLAGCTPEQVDLLLDGLHGFAIHVVVTGDPPAAWSPVVKPERLHLIDVPDTDPEQAVWTAFGEIVGFDAAALPLSAAWSLPRPEPSDVLAEVARLRAHNRVLEERNAKLERKKDKLKRKLAETG
ncbi:hypothetical protein GCM10027062_10500 [Nocardioides hungaricus]